MATDIKQSARKFREFWTLAKDSEVGGYQKFWLSLLGDVLGMDDVMSRISFQSPVQLKDTTKFLDAWIPETRVLIEHKARNVKLDAPQAGHGGKTPFEQALEYNFERPYSEKARWIVTCNFLEIWVYDMDHPHADPQKILLANLPKEISRLGFLVDMSVKTVREKEMDISIKAGRIVGELYKALLKRYRLTPICSDGSTNVPPDGKSDTAEAVAKASDESELNIKLAALNRLCVRLVFCFYAEDAEIFPKDCFWKLLSETPAKFLRDRIIRLFRTLDTPEGERDPYLEPELAAFPYTNGGLFRGVSDAEIPPLDDDIKELLIKSSDFDWRDISPTIFGALFESTLNPETRRAGGMVYTSVENIHKVIDPLFMNDLTAELESIKSERAITVRRAKAMSFQDKLGSLTFLDPACGSGNFLTETFLSLRKLENEAIVVGERLKPGEVLLNLDGIVKVSIKQFHGIEINDFAVSVAKTAMWISEAKMLNETANILHAPPKYLPLHDYDGIVEGNALRLDWPQTDYIMGNPPFVGAMWMKGEKRTDVELVFPECEMVGQVDYVSGWFAKAAKFILGTNIRCAFVATNSICQGQQVALIWKPLFEKYNIHIDFAYRTFKWDNEAAEKAHVHCVIVGFSSVADARQRIIYVDERNTIDAKNINGYLSAADNVFIRARREQVSGKSPMHMGVMARDGGHLILSQEEYEDYVVREPIGKQWIHKYMMGREFINNIRRYCFWLADANPADVRKCPLLLKRLELVKKARLESPAKETQKLADTPMLFAQLAQPKANFIAFPKVSSQQRQYIPIGFLTPDIIVGDKIYVVENVGLYDFGILTSGVHNAWMRAVAGRMKSDYSYSNTIVYNNFPWPTLSDSATLREKISQTAQAILDVRGKYPDSSLADLYDLLTMPPDLRAAHAANDRAVLAAYGLKPDTPEPEIVAHLFKLYAEMTENA